MRIIAESRLREFGDEYRDAKSAIGAFAKVAKRARWSNLTDVRRTYPHADPVRVASGKVVTVFNIRGNHYRLITAVHYNTGLLYVLRFLPHSEYSKDLWKVGL
jgi:mRNA interferase HigB